MEENEVPKRAGITSGYGEKANDMLPHEPRGELRLMSPKSAVSVNFSERFFAHADRPLKFIHIHGEGYEG